jgi:hypothetical protein
VPLFRITMTLLFPFVVSPSTVRAESFGSIARKPPAPFVLSMSKDEWSLRTGVSKPEQLRTGLSNHERSHFDPALAGLSANGHTHRIRHRINGWGH